MGQRPFEASHRGPWPCSGTSAAVILLSVVSAWEILVKSHLGKLSLRMPLDQILAQQVANGLRSCPSPSNMPWVWRPFRISTKTLSTGC